MRCVAGLQGLAQRDDVAALGHRHAQRDHLPSLVAHQHLRRIDEAARDRGDVRQPQHAARAAPDRHVAQLLERTELSRHAHLHRVQRRLHDACALDGVLLVQLRQHLVHVQSELGQAPLRDLDIDPLVLDTEQLDLVHVGHAQQLLAHAIGEGLEFRVAEAIGLQRVDHTVHVAEFVVEIRPAHTGRQAGGHVTDPLAHGVPRVGHSIGPGRVPQLEQDQRLTGLGIAANLVRAGHLLQGALDLVGHLLGDLLRGRTRPEHPHHHDPERERRILVLSELEIGGRSQHHQHHHQVARQCDVLQGPPGEIEAGPGV